MILENVFYAISKGLSYKDGQIIGVSGKPLRIIRSKGSVTVKIPLREGGFTHVNHSRLVYYFETRDVSALMEEFDVVFVDRDRFNNVFSNLKLVPHSTRNQTNAKITPEQARVIHDMYAKRKTKSSKQEFGKITYKSLADEYGVSVSTIMRIANA